MAGAGVEGITGGAAKSIEIAYRVATRRGGAGNCWREDWGATDGRQVFVIGDSGIINLVAEHSCGRCAISIAGDAGCQRGIDFELTR